MTSQIQTRPVTAAEFHAALESIEHGFHGHEFEAQERIRYFTGDDLREGYLVSLGAEYAAAPNLSHLRVQSFRSAPDGGKKHTSQLDLDFETHDPALLVAVFMASVELHRAKLAAGEIFVY